MRVTETAAAGDFAKSSGWVEKGLQVGIFYRVYSSSMIARDQVELVGHVSQKVSNMSPS